MDELLYAFFYSAGDFKDSLDSFNEFDSPLTNLIDEYFPSLSSFFYWGYITDGRKEHRAVNYIDKSDYERIKSLDFITYFRVVNDDSLSYTIFPIDIYNGAVSTILVKNKEEFLSKLHLKAPIQLYFACPFLVELLRSAIEYSMFLKHPDLSSSFEFERDIYSPADGYGFDFSENDNETDDGLDNIFTYLENVDKNRDLYFRQKIINEVVARTLNLNSLPYVSFFHSIANSYYEGNENIGVIEFYETMKGQPDAVELINHDSLDNADTKLLRKLLEMTNSHNKLLISKCPVKRSKKPNLLAQWQLFGIGNSDSNPFSRVEFRGISKWDIFMGEEIASYAGESFKIRNGFAHYDETETNIIVQYFKKYDKWIGRYAKLDIILRALKKQQHGTMVVVCENAQSEADRLCNANRGIKTAPFDFSKLSEERIIKLSSIDGAILLDQDATCYALGVILDGYIDKEFIGDSGRGARYNSAKLYIHNIIQKKKTSGSSQTIGDAMAIVLSEDKYLNVFSTTEDEHNKD